MTEIIEVEDLVIEAQASWLYNADGGFREPSIAVRVKGTDGLPITGLTSSNFVVAQIINNDAGSVRISVVQELPTSLKFLPGTYRLILNTGVSLSKDAAVGVPGGQWTFAVIVKKRLRSKKLQPQTWRTGQTLVSVFRNLLPDR